MADREGAPTKYKSEYALQGYKYCLLGATDADLATMFEVDEATINRWKKAHKEFCESIKKGKDIADANVADRLYQRALGYEHKEDYITQYQGMPVIIPTVKHYAPDPTAAIFWLKNRRPKSWRDKQEVEAHNTNDNTNLSLDIADPDQLRKEIDEMIQRRNAAQK